MKDARISRIGDLWYMTTCSVSSERHCTSLYVSSNGLDGIVTSLKEEHENSASRIFSNDRDCLAPHVHSRRAKGSGASLQK